MKLQLQLIVGFLICSFAFLQAQTTEGTLTFTFSHTRPTSNYQDGDILAVWVEHSDGTFIKAKMRYGTQETDHLPDFALKAGGDPNNSSSSNIDFTDATTGSTLKSSSGNPRAWTTYTVVWNGKDLVGNTVQDGNYTIFVESAWDAGNENHPVHDYVNNYTFTKGPNDDSINLAGDSIINTITLNWVASSLGIEDNNLNNKVFVYPNPSTGIVNVLYNEIPVSKIKVLNILGQVVKSIEIDPSKSEKSQSIDLTENANGLYIINVSTKETSSSYKVVLNN